MQEHGGKYRSIVKYMRGVLSSRFGISRGRAGCSSAPSAWVLWEYEGEKKQQAVKTSSSGFRPPNSKTTKKTTKKTTRSKKRQDQKKTTCKTEYLMINLAGQTTLVVQRQKTTTFFFWLKTHFRLANRSTAFYVIKYNGFCRSLRTLRTLVYFSMTRFIPVLSSGFSFTSVSTRIIIVEMQLFLPFRPFFPFFPLHFSKITAKCRLYYSITTFSRFNSE